jgi:caffeoyl-CoA O-methyltransferase
LLRLLPNTIEDYVLQHTPPLPPLLQEVLATTHERLGRRALMLSGPVEGTLLQILALSVGARRILELGTFTGFSALMMAAALPEDGRLITCDVDPETNALARGFFARSPHGHKIEPRLGPALETIKTLQGPYDLVFLDADKESYVACYEAVLPLLAPNGLIVADNTLSHGDVVNPQSERGRVIAAFNAHVHNDPRTTNALLTVRDGIMLIRRVG